MSEVRASNYWGEGKPRKEEGRRMKRNQDAEENLVLGADGDTGASDLLGVKSGGSGNLEGVRNLVEPAGTNEELLLLVLGGSSAAMGQSKREEIAKVTTDAKRFPLNSV